MKVHLAKNVPAETDAASMSFASHSLPVDPRLPLRTETFVDMSITSKSLIITENGGTVPYPPDVEFKVTFIMSIIGPSSIRQVTLAGDASMKCSTLHRWLREVPETSPSEMFTIIRYVPVESPEADMFLASQDPPTYSSGSDNPRGAPFSRVTRNEASPALPPSSDPSLLAVAVIPRTEYS